MADLAVAITLGANRIRDIRLLEHRRPVFGLVDSYPTLWRTLSEIDALTLSRIDRARAVLRRHVHALLWDCPEGFPGGERRGGAAPGADGDRQ